MFNSAKKVMTYISRRLISHPTTTSATGICEHVYTPLRPLQPSPDQNMCGSCAVNEADVGPVL